MQKMWLIVLTVGAWAVAGASFAEELTSEEVAQRLFSADEVESDWFASQGLSSAVPRIVGELQQELGTLQSIEPCTPKCVARFEKGEFSFDIATTTNGRISSLWIDPPMIYSATLDEAISRFSELPGEVSIYVSGDGATLGSIKGGTPLAVGSAFKLAVLKALNTLIGAGKLEWDQVVNFKDDWRSLPSGQLQDWPSNAPITVHTLASLMMSVSDNTATDALIDLVSRGSVETISPLNRPFLTTREFFQLKRRDAVKARQAFAEGNFDDRMRILATVADEPLPAIGDLITDPLLQIEWFFSAEELCGLMTDVRHLDVAQISPGIALKSDWDHIAYKGGSDFGALNFTTSLTAKNGETYCVSATWNDSAPLDETTFTMLYGGLLHQLK